MLVIKRSNGVDELATGSQLLKLELLIKVAEGYKSGTPKEMKEEASQGRNKQRPHL